ncbi:MAG: 30S ribosomal protein S8 [Dehalococcoidales bacterium]|nr:30S ribosomal protein S8 [Dehalococcoidales bacterium]
MNLTDPIADMLTRIRNAIQARHDQVYVPASRIKLAIARILKEEGYIRDFEVTRDGPRRIIRIWLKYADQKQPVLTGLRRVSRPGKRVYSGSETLPRVLGGLGVAVVSTPAGVMTAQQARKRRIGGEVLCFIW